ncbi:MAG: UvrB/UvrC motif-containing protein [Planctomycetes bacterium]|nr:UvrB/UvrC motif-containing protein [Planctomycetota bacterium]
MYERFTDRARKVMQLANQEAQRLNHEYIGTEHILLGLVKEGSGVAANVLKNLDIDLRKIRLEVEKLVQSSPEVGTPGKLPQTPRAKKVIEYSIEEARNLNHNYVGTEHLLLGLLREQEGVAAQVLMNLGLRLEDVREEVLNLLGHNMETHESSIESAGGERQATKGKSKTPALDSFGRDLTELARQGKLDPVIGRSNEIEEVLVVLNCRHRHRPLLVCETLTEVGAVVEGLAQRIVNGSVPFELAHSRVVALDLYVLTSHTAQGEAEGRLRRVLNEASRAQVLLFLPDLRSLLEATAAGLDAVFRTALRSAPPSLLAAVTPSDLRTHVEPDATVRDAFQTVLIRPPRKEHVLAILETLRGGLETHHGVRITDEALRAAVELADRNLSGPSLKDLALQVLDRAGARLRLSNRGQPPPAVTELNVQIELLEREKESAVAEQAFEKAAQLRQQANTLKKQKESLLAAWLQPGAPSGIVDEELIREIVTRMAPPLL